MKWDENAQTFKVEGLTEGINDGDVGIMRSVVGSRRNIAMMRCTLQKHFEI